ncbi:hypothetical protein [Haladaptatus sp. T7]|uniref:hypothetical protein n=1 Tax=Haladaptatus sp. T7 TaxID=2029368 RepID=UPI00222E347A|nr:hypothetical protein [Haladaptatus sp. T7]
MNTFVEVTVPVEEFALEADGHTLGATETGSTLCWVRRSVRSNGERCREPSSDARTAVIYDSASAPLRSYR